jgi:cytochrome c biogenesis protein CcdA
MGLMAFMEAMGTSSIPLLAAFFIGLMTAISPCPLATNITAIAYTSKRIVDSKHTLVVGFLYTLGRMFTYVSLALLIIWIGVNTQTVSLFLQSYGERMIGPLLILIGIVLLDVIKFNFFDENSQITKLKETLAKKGFLGAFLLGAVFALAFCPFSAVLFFGMIIPLALKAGDGIFIPLIFAFATGLPVMIFSFILVYSVSRLGNMVDKVQTFERWTRKIVSIVFIVVGIYYSTMIYVL